MPIGWAETAKAHVDNTYPSDPRREVSSCTGEPDGAKNAELWAAEKNSPKFVICFPVPRSFL